MKQLLLCTVAHLCFCFQLEAAEIIDLHVQRGLQDSKLVDRIMPFVILEAKESVTVDWVAFHETPDSSNWSPILFQDSTGTSYSLGRQQTIKNTSDQRQAFSATLDYPIDLFGDSSRRSYRFVTYGVRIFAKDELVERANIFYSVPHAIDQSATDLVNQQPKELPPIAPETVRTELPSETRSVWEIDLPKIDVQLSQNPKALSAEQIVAIQKRKKMRNSLVLRLGFLRGLNSRECTSLPIACSSRSLKRLILGSGFLISTLG